MKSGPSDWPGFLCLKTMEFVRVFQRDKSDFGAMNAEKELFCGAFCHQFKEAAIPSDISQRVFRLSS
jgi:hypothetical protein